MSSFAGVVGAMLLGATGCYIVEQPGPETSFQTAGDVRLERALRRAAAVWADHGLEIAERVTVNEGRHGMSVRFASAAELAEACPDDRPAEQIGCTHWAMGDWLGMLIRADVAGDPVLLSYIVQHEMVHALVPDAPHLVPGLEGIFSASRTVRVVTVADLENLAPYTAVHIAEVDAR